MKAKLKPAGMGGGEAAGARHPMMRRYPTLCLLMVSAFVSACEPQIYGTVLDHRGERAYLPNTDTPFTGVSQVYYKNNDQLYIRTSYKNGFLDGFAQRWHPNGQLASKNTYKNGAIEGLDTWWYENGQKRWEIVYKNDKQHGRALYWDEDGKRQPDICWQNGKRVAMSQCGG